MVILHANCHTYVTTRSNENWLSVRNLLQMFFEIRILSVISNDQMSVNFAGDICIKNHVSIAI